MRHGIITVSLLAALFAGGCRVNQAPGAPAPPTQHPHTKVWAADGVLLVHNGLPMFLVDGRYWHWHEGDWHVWRDVGWQISRPPAELTRMDDRRVDGTLQLDVTPAVDAR